MTIFSRPVTQNRFPKVSKSRVCPDRGSEHSKILRRTITDSSKSISFALKKLLQRLSKVSTSLDQSDLFQPIQNDLEAQIDILRTALTQAQDPIIRAQFSDNNLEWLKNVMLNRHMHHLLKYAHQLSQIDGIPTFFATGLKPQLQVLRSLLISITNNTTDTTALVSELSKPNPADEILRNSHEINRVINSPSSKLDSRLQEVKKLAGVILETLSSVTRKKLGREVVHQTKDNVERSIATLNRISQNVCDLGLGSSLKSTIQLLEQISLDLSPKARVDEGKLNIITAVKKLKAALKPGTTKTLEPALEGLIVLAKEAPESASQIFTALYRAYRVFNQRVRELNEDPTIIENKRSLLLTALREVYAACPQEPIAYKDGMQTRVLTVDDVLAELDSARDHKKNSRLEDLLRNINRIFTKKMFTGHHGITDLRTNLQSIVAKLKHSATQWPMVFDNLLAKVSSMKELFDQKTGLSRREARVQSLLEGTVRKTIELSRQNRLSTAPLTPLVS